MPKYKPVDFNQVTLIPVDFDQQIIKGSFEYTLHQLIEERLDTSIFDSRYKNDKTGASAYNPKHLLKSSSLPIPSALHRPEKLNTSAKLISFLSPSPGIQDRISPPSPILSLDCLGR